MRKVLLSLLLLWITVAPAGAENENTALPETGQGGIAAAADTTEVAASSSIVVEQPAPLSRKRKRKRVERPQRIDREIMKSVFVPKGQWLAGGAISYSEHEEDNLNFLVLKDITGRGYTFSTKKFRLSSSCSE